MGPDEDLGYVVAKPNPLGNVPNPLGVPAYVSFSRTTDFTDQAFVDLVNSITNNSFTDASTAKTYLDNNGYWTSWVSQTVDLGIGTTFESGSTVANYTLTSSESLNTDLTVNFVNTLFDTCG